MEILTLYHGSNQKFNNIDLSKSKNHRDFGCGFYMTTLEEQAKAWAENMFIRYGGDGKFVYAYEFEENPELNIKRYNNLNTEWLEMIKENRLKGGLQHSYDAVYGPVANDNTMRTIALFIAGIYTSENALEKLRFFKANDQLSVHTEKALKYLRLIGRNVSE
ncbi:MAG: DUF3990 domain-containing protein [Oscillospiraceae bacterium]|jgi:hypothetical protein|nr:DUF3990 domain-containing protein [Oscillospiraceae bacterium]